MSVVATGCSNASVDELLPDFFFLLILFKNELQCSCMHKEADAESGYELHQKDDCQQQENR